jgi:small-conductance mechanosensitive channel
VSGAVTTFWDPVYHDGLVALAILIGVLIVARVIARVLFVALLRIAQRRGEGVYAALVRRAQAPAGIAIPLLAAIIAIPNLRFPSSLDVGLLRGVEIATTVAAAWGIVATIELYGDLVKRRFRLDDTDNLRARQVETRIDILSRTAITLVVIVAAALAATTFPPIRTLGTTLLASAGVAGIVVGLAARPLFENLVAGVQIALTQPIRLDDVVLVENEYGRVEHIGATYVVVNLWDRRRMVLPLTYFIEKPFQNWTRTGATLVGTVIVYADFSVHVDAVREALPNILRSSVLWDGDVHTVQVTDATETAMQLRIVVSARSAYDLWDLRCEVREKVIAWLQNHYPASSGGVRFAAPRGDGATTPAAG